MQVLGRDFEAERLGKVSQDFAEKLRIAALTKPTADEEPPGPVEVPRGSAAAGAGPENVRGDALDDDDSDFSFDCGGLNSPVAADSLFHEGQIRTSLPLFAPDATQLRPPLKKIFVEEEQERPGDAEASGPFCKWSGKAVEAAPEPPGGCKKSNSTGFSKRWRFRDLVLRSNSDGKDAFVFLNTSDPSVANKTESDKQSRRVEKPNPKGDKNERVPKPKHRDQTTTSTTRSPQPTSAAAAAHQRLYGKNKAREGEKRRSYLPYKQFGFFTSVNGLSRNLHPF